MKDIKKVIVGADPFPPYQFYNAGRLEGTDYRAIDQCLDRLGLDREYILAPWAEIEQMLTRGKIDMAFQVQKTPEREKIYHFSKLLRNAVTGFVSLAPLKLDHVSDIKKQGLTLAVIDGYQYGPETGQLCSASKICCADIKGQAAAVINGRADLAVVDIGVFTYLKENGANPLQTLHILPSPMFERPLYVVFKDMHLRDKFNSEM